MSYVLTGAVRLSGMYVDENGAERQYVVTRGQNVSALGLPHSVVQELIGKTRPLGGRRGTPIPYFTKVDDIPTPSEEDRDITVQSLNEGIHKSRVEAGVIEPDAEFEKELAQPPAEPDEPLDKFARTPEEAEAAATGEPGCCGEGEACSREDCTGTPRSEEPASEPVVSPDEDVEGEATCAKPDCAVAGDVASCEDDNCPVNEAPVEEGSVEDAEPVAEVAETREPADEVAKVEEKPAAKKAPAKKSGGKGKKGGSKKSGKSSK